MVVANRLNDGRVVFLTAAGRWVESIADGSYVSDAGAAASLLARAQADEAANRVVEPYLIDVEETGGVRRPAAWREVIRADGPTVRTDLPPAPPAG
jgi:hypothetical protein